MSHWRQEIADGILKANTFLFILSPDSVKSKECQRELEYALEHNKRLVAIVYQAVNSELVHPALSALNWIFFDGDFTQSFAILLTAIDTDLEHVQEHTRLLLKAEEWKTKAKDEACLLRGSNLEAAESWISHTSGKNPQPTQLQREYVQSSRIAETKRQRQKTRSLVIGLVSISVLAAVASVQSFVAEARRKEAVISEINALSTSSDALFIAKREFDGLLQGLHAARLLKKNANWINEDTRLSVMANFGKAVYRIRERNRLEGHVGFVSRISFSPDGQYLVSGSQDRRINLWKLDGTLVKTFIGHEGSVTDVSFSPDGQTIASASRDHTVRLWKLDGTLLKKLPHPDEVRAVAFSSDGQLLASGSHVGTHLWKSDGTFIATLPGRKDRIWSVAFSPDNQLLASTGRDKKTLNLWTRDGKPLWTKESQASVTSVSFSPNSQMIASSNIDGILQLWSRDGKSLKTIEAHPEAIYGVSFSPDGKYLATASADRTIRLWQPNGTLMATLYGHTRLVNSVRFSPDGKTIASSGQDQSVRLWQEANSLMTLLIGHDKAVNTVRFSNYSGKIF